VHISRQLGEPLPIAQPDIDALYDRYQNVYGQSTTAVSLTPPSDGDAGADQENAR